MESLKVPEFADKSYGKVEYDFSTKPIESIFSKNMIEFGEEK